MNSIFPDGPDIVSKINQFLTLPVIWAQPQLTVVEREEVLVAHLVLEGDHVDVRGHHIAQPSHHS